jgi:hypothetical protein
LPSGPKKVLESPSKAPILSCRMKAESPLHLPRVGDDQIFLKEFPGDKLEATDHWPPAHATRESCGPGGSVSSDKGKAVQREAAM